MLKDIREDCKDEVLRRVTGKGGTSWETGAARRIRKRAGNRTPINSSKRQKTKWSGSRRESPDRNHGEMSGILFTAAK